MPGSAIRLDRHSPQPVLDHPATGDVEHDSMIAGTGGAGVDGRGSPPQCGPLRNVARYYRRRVRLNSPVPGMLTVRVIRPLADRE